MTTLNLVRIPIKPAALLRFAHAYGITQTDETLGYTLHAWFAALFAELSPKPFRYLERRGEVLGYAAQPAEVLLEHAQAFATPEAWAALEPTGVMSKPMPSNWRAGQRLHLEVLACPVSRCGREEKDLYLHAIDRLGDEAPPRAVVYRDWFVRQWGSSVRFGRIELIGLQSRAKHLRRAHQAGLSAACLQQAGQAGTRLRIVERPQALFAAEAEITDGEAFAALLERGIGRHRAFGFGMILLAPPR